MAIVDLIDGNFHLDTYGLPVKRQRKVFETLDQLATHLFTLATGKNIPRPDTPSVKDIVEAFVTHALSTNKISVKYHKRIKASMKAMHELMRLPVTQFDKAALDAYVTKRLKKVKPATVKADYIILHSALNYAVSRNSIPVNPINGYWRGIKMNHKINTIPMPDKLQELMDNLDDDAKKAVWFCLATGCRFNDMAALEVADIANGSIHFHHCKLGCVRYCPLPERPDSLGIRLRHGQLPFALPTTGLVFTNKGKMWTSAPLRKRIQKVCRSIGIDELTVHDMRRIHATYRLANGGSIYDIMAQCGWKSIEMIQRYAQVATHYAKTPNWLPDYNHARAAASAISVFAKMRKTLTKSS